MKDFYTKPEVDVETFATVDVVTTSVVTSDDDKRKQSSFQTFKK